MMKRFNKVELPKVELGDLDVPMNKGDLQNWLKKVVRRINAAIESLVAGINSQSGLFAEGEEIEIKIDSGSPGFAVDKEIVIRHHLGTVPRGYLPIWAFPRRPTYGESHPEGGYTEYTWNGGSDDDLNMGKTPWTDTHVYFYPSNNAVAFRVYYRVFLIR